MNLPLLLGSLVAILVLAAVAYSLGLGKPMTLDHSSAGRLAEESVGGFIARSVALARDGTGAMVLGRDGDVVLLKVAGARVAARHFTDPPAQHERADGIEIDSGDRWFGRLVLSHEALAGPVDHSAHS